MAYWVYVGSTLLVRQNKQFEDIHIGLWDIVMAIFHLITLLIN